MSLSGMTGFGRADGAAGGWTWAAEARSVNGRNLEVRFRGPPGFEGLEKAVRDGAATRFQRGQIQVSLQASRAQGVGGVRINLEQLARYLAAGEAYVASGRVAAPTLDGLLALRGVIETDDGAADPDTTAAVEAAMAVSLAAALDAMALARRDEGHTLSGLLAGLVARIDDLTRKAGEAAAEQPAVIRDRMARRLTELANEAATQDRILQEAASLAVKADVREELDRLAAHVASARALLATTEPVGRRLDFLTQEFMREANTLCAKSALPGLTAAGLDLKAVIEQVREQVQNVE